MIDPAARARLEWWKASLLDLTTANRLLDARDGRTCIALPGVDAVAVAAALAGGAAFAVATGDPPGLRGLQLAVPLPAAELHRRLVMIRRAARSQLADRGEHTLWLALGMLVWGDVAAPSRAPLALWPVELERSEGGTLRLVAAEGVAPCTNIVLAEKLRRDFEILLPDSAFDLAALFAAAESIALTRPGWRVEHGALLGCFSFAKLALWRDLEARGDDLLASPVVAHLSLASGIGFPQVSPDAAGVVTLAGRPDWRRAASAWAGELLAPLDADASQLHAVAAAGAGASFVLQGAPGTGKSQTIANLVAHCVAQGKTVLVVSQHVTALADVQARLASVGLGDVCLALPRASDRTRDRAAVVAQLGRVLERTFRPGSGPSLSGNERLGELRVALDGHVEALHRIGAFGRSLHEVLGRLVELRTAPRAQLADSDAVGLNAATFNRRRAAVAELADAALAVEPVASHPWRTSTLERFEGREPPLAALDEAAAAAASLHAATRDVASLVPGLVARTRTQLQALGALAALSAASPRPGGELLTHLRAARNSDELGEQIALVRARGTGAIETPRDPLAYLALANRHRALVAEVAERFSDAEGLDAPTLWAQLRKWTHSVAPVRFVALRKVRAEVKAAAVPGELSMESDGTMITALEAVLAERACRAALAAAAEPARRWFGEVGGDPTALESFALDKIDSALAWAGDLRRAFDAVDVIGGDAGRNTAWRALVAQVAASPAAARQPAQPPAPREAAIADVEARFFEDDDGGGEGRDTVRDLGLRAAAETLPSTLHDTMFDRVTAQRDGDHRSTLPTLDPDGDRRVTLRDGVASAGLVRDDDRVPSDAFTTLREGDRRGLAGVRFGDATPATVGAEITVRNTPADLVVFARLAEAVARWLPALARLADATGIARDELGGGDDHLAALRERVETLRHAIDSLGPWVTFHAARHDALACGIGPAVHLLERGDLGADELAQAWERATLLAWAEAELRASELAAFHGAAHHAHVAAFADLDRAALALVRSRALARLAERVPQRRAPGDDPERTVLVEELARVRRSGSIPPIDTQPLRALFAALPTLLPRLAPCLAMTPLSVASYLPPGMRFDIVVLDEASQLPTADAIGALARGESAVIVGDAHQLPPTRVLETGDQDGIVAELESILDDCVAARLPELALAWHYRSRHEDLIALANEHYYGDHLQVFAAAQASAELGIAWRRVDGVFDRMTRQNRGEAEAVVADVVARLRDPAQRGRSLAVITLSRAQQELVEDLLDAARAADPSLDAAFEPTDDLVEPIPPVIVKNVETAQGDERDVVLLSIGYDPELADDLGVVVGKGGERRLAVAMTRAREQLVVFASFDPEALPADGRGVRDLAALLRFARSGGGAVRSPGIARDLPASPITAAIARSLEERGWLVHHQVGCGAYKVDLAIVDPNDPERYVLAIEHDGVAYASATAARDRDRLRAQVLGQLGWKLHRVWSLDWWTDPEREIQRAHAAIVTAIAATRQRRASPVRAEGSAPVKAKRGSVPVMQIPPKKFDAAAPAGAPIDAPIVAIADSTIPTLASGSAPVRLGRNAIPIGPYTAAAIPPGRRTPDDLFAPRHLAELGKVVEQVLAAEAPMHVDLLSRRVGAYFGIGRVTQRVTEQIRTVIVGRGHFGDEANVIWRLDQDPGAVPPVRVAPGPGGAPTGRRDIAEIPLSELAAAARIVVERAATIAAADLVRDAARLMGFARITDAVTDRVAQGVRLAQARELIRVESGKAMLPD